MPRRTDHAVASHRIPVRPMKKMGPLIDVHRPGLAQQEPAVVQIGRHAVQAQAAAPVSRCLSALTPQIVVQADRPQRCQHAHQFGSIQPLLLWFAGIRHDQQVDQLVRIRQPSAVIHAGRDGSVSSVVMNLTPDLLAYLVGNRQGMDDEVPLSADRQSQAGIPSAYDYADAPGASAGLDDLTGQLQRLVLGRPMVLGVQPHRRTEEHDQQNGEHRKGAQVGTVHGFTP